MDKYGKAIIAGIGVAMVSLEPQYGKYAWFIAIPAIYTALATYMSAPAILPTSGAVQAPR